MFCYFFILNVSLSARHERRKETERRISHVPSLPDGGFARRKHQQVSPSLRHSDVIEKKPGSHRLHHRRGKIIVFVLISLLCEIHFGNNVLFIVF